MIVASNQATRNMSLKLIFHNLPYMEAILTDFRFYTNYANIHISKYFYLS